MRNAFVVGMLFCAAALCAESDPAASAVVRLEADRLVRWTEGDAVLTDLRGNAAVYQGDFHVRADRLLVRFIAQESETGRSAALEIVAPPETKTESQSLRTIRLNTTAGIVWNGHANTGDTPSEDAFLRAARQTLSGKASTVEADDLPKGLPANLVDELRPSAEEISVSGDAEKGVSLTLSGNARIAARDFELNADVIRVQVRFKGEGFTDPEVAAVFADGVVDLKREKQRITADSVYLDPLNQEGLALNATVRSEVSSDGMAIQFHTDVVRQVSRYRFVCETPTFFTSSQFAKPHYRIQSDAFSLTLSEDTRAVTRPGAPTFQAPKNALVAAEGNTARVGDVPVLYWPYLKKDLSPGMMLLKSIEVGADSRMGTFVKTGWNLYDLGLLYNDWSEMTLLADVYSDRGVGLGLNLEYSRPARFGHARAYYINDRKNTDDRNLPNPRDDRGEFTWRHREFLPWDFVANLELGALSDRNFLRIYERDEYDEEKDRETTVFLSRASGNALLTAQGSWRMNDFQNALEKQSLALHSFGVPIGDSPLRWTSHNELANLQTRTDEALSLPDAKTVQRFDTAHEFSLPLQSDWLTVEPYAWADLTGYSDQANGREEALRAATGFGLRAAANFFRTFDAQSDLFGVDRLRHIMTPTVDYTVVSAVSKQPGRIIQNDAIDALDERLWLTAGIHNRLQTYRVIDGERRLEDFLIFDVDYVAKLRNAAGEGLEQDLLETNLLWRMTPNVALISEDNRYNVEDGKVERVNGTLEFTYWRPVTVRLAQDYYLDTMLARRPEHMVSRLEMEYQPIYSRWRVEASVGYDFKAQRQPGDTKDPEDLESSIYFYRQLEDWEVAVGAEFNSGRSNSTALRFKLEPPTTSNVNRSFR